MEIINVDATTKALNALEESNPELKIRCSIIKANLQLYKYCDQEDAEEKEIEIAIGRRKLQKEIENTNGNMRDYHTATVMKAAIYSILENNADYEIIMQKRITGANC